MFGGDDLFGDLPSAKNDTKESINMTSKLAKEENKEQKRNSMKQTQSNATSLLVSALGSAGTSMAFVPSALQRRKRQHSSSSSAVPQKREKNPQINTETTTTTTTSSEINSPGSYAINVGKRTTTKVIHNVTPKNSTEDNSTKKQHTLTATEMHRRHEEKECNELSSNEYQESSEILALHTHVSTILMSSEPYLIYDPHSPNDYLRFKQEESQKTYRAELEASAREALEVQRVMQEQVERERKAIENTGDFDQIVASRTNAGRGRGRGVSNLPAWLVKKREQRQQNDSLTNITGEN